MKKNKLETISPTKPEKEQPQQLSIKDMIAKAKEKAAQGSKQTRAEGLLPIGTRVFHTHFGVGKITNVIKDENESSYVVDFTKSGEKTLDSNTSGLKTF